MNSHSSNKAKPRVYKKEGDKESKAQGGEGRRGRRRREGIRLKLLSRKLGRGLTEVKEVSRLFGVEKGRKKVRFLFLGNSFVMDESMDS